MLTKQRTDVALSRKPLSPALFLCGCDDLRSLPLKRGGTAWRQMESVSFRVARSKCQPEAEKVWKSVVKEWARGIITITLPEAFCLLWTPCLHHSGASPDVQLHQSQQCHCFFAAHTPICNRQDHRLPVCYRSNFGFYVCSLGLSMAPSLFI